MTDQAKAPFTLEGNLKPYLTHNSGQTLELPNFQPLDLAVAVGKFASTGGWECVENAFVKTPGRANRYGTYAKVFLRHGQMSGPDGTGIVLWTDYGPTGAQVFAGQFALCVHEPVEGAGANHQRGWHPARCSKCGLNMSVDSGD